MVKNNPVATAIAVAGMARDGCFKEIEELFAPQLRAVVSAETLETAWVNEIKRNGPVVTIGDPMSESKVVGLTRVSVPVTCEHGELRVIMSVDKAGLLNGLRLAPATDISWTPPSYAALKKFREHNVMVGSGMLSVPGTLSLPSGLGRWPGVVLLSGGGPFDRDETSGRNKPLRDIAWGLASLGIAVLRFDKVTYAHGNHVANAHEFTMTDEYVPHAVAAFNMLQKQPHVDPKRVFILGHSMGGKVAPRVAAAEPSIAGLVILAGDTQPMQRAAIRVARYLATLNPSPTVMNAVEVITRQAEMVESPNLSLSTPARELPFGFSASYWLDMREYNPVTTAEALNKPMLILQGGRDYQVTVEDDLSLWRAGLGHRPDVTIRVYEADNHMFFPGTGQSTPAEYEPAQHVDPAIITDIAHWLISNNSNMEKPEATTTRKQGFFARVFGKSGRN